MKSFNKRIVYSSKTHKDVFTKMNVRGMVNESI